MFLNFGFAFLNNYNYPISICEIVRVEKAIPRLIIDRDGNLEAVMFNARCESDDHFGAVFDLHVQFSNLMYDGTSKAWIIKDFRLSLQDGV